MQCPQAQQILPVRGFRVWSTYPLWTIVCGMPGSWIHEKDQEEEEQNSLLAIQPLGIWRDRMGAIRCRARRGKERRTRGDEEDVPGWVCLQWRWLTTQWR